MLQNINKQLLPLKVYFFWYFGGLACIVPYMPVFAHQLGFSTGELAVVYGILPFIGLLSKPFVGIIADKLRAHRLVLLIALIVQGVFTFVVYYLPAMPVEPPANTGVQLSCNDRGSVLDVPGNASTVLCGKANLTVQCSFKDPNPYVYQALNVSGIVAMPMEFFLEVLAPGVGGVSGGSVPVALTYLGQSRTKCTDPISTNCTALLCRAPDASSDFVRFNFQFWLFLIVMTIGRVGYTAVYTMGDSVAFDLLGQQKKPTSYGAQRVFGSIGWATAAVIVGILMDNFTERRPQTDFAPAFYGFVSLLLCAMITAFFMKPSEGIRSTQILKNVLKLFEDKEFFTFSCGTLFVGMLTGLLYTYLFIYMEDLSAPKLLMGLSQLAECVGEAPFMFFSKWLISRLGHHGAMTLALASFCVRYIAYSLIGSNPWWILVLELFHGPGFGLFYANMATFAYDVAPEGAVATMQGVLGGIYDGFGIALGALIGGTIYKRFGGRAAWRSFGVAAGIIAIVYLCITLYFNRRKKKMLLLDNLQSNGNSAHHEMHLTSGYETPIPPDTPSEKERLTHSLSPVRLRAGSENEGIMEGR